MNKGLCVFHILSDAITHVNHIHHFVALHSQKGIASASASTTQQYFLNNKEAQVVKAVLTFIHWLPQVVEASLYKLNKNIHCLPPVSKKTVIK